MLNNTNNTNNINNINNTIFNVIISDLIKRDYQNAINNINKLTKTEIEKYENENKETLLIIACYLRAERIIDILLEKTDDEYINRISKNNISAFGVCCDKNIENIAIKIFRRTKSEIINLEGVEKTKGKTPLYMASKRNMVNLIKEMLESGKIDDKIYKYKTDKNYSIGYWMYNYNMEEYIKKIDFDREIINSVIENNNTIIIQSIKNRNYKLCSDLIDKTDEDTINIRDEEGLTVFDYAVKYRNSELMKRLKDKIKPQTNNIKILCNNKKKKMLREYINKIDKEDIKENNLLIHRLCEKNMEESVILLIEKISREEINKLDERNNSVLYYAIKNKMINFIKEIINKIDKDMIKREYNGKKLYEMCVENQLFEIAYLIMKKIN